jgi:hypothetical protein
MTGMQRAAALAELLFAIDVRVAHAIPYRCPAK